MAHFCSKDQSIILGPSTEIIEKYSKQVRENNALELQPAELEAWRRWSGRWNN